MVRDCLDKVKHWVELSDGEVGWNILQVVLDFGVTVSYIFVIDLSLIPGITQWNSGVSKGPSFPPQKRGD
jgi:hypothetical protein